jgi:uncharacterized protein (TIGR02466 family)
MPVEKITPFVTPIWKFNIGADFDVEIATCYEIQNELPSTGKSNLGGYQSPTINLKTKFPNLMEKISPELNTVVTDSELKISIDNAWININKNRDANHSHYHPYSALSGVIYLQFVFNAGEIVFENPTISGVFPIDDSVQHFFGCCKLVPTIGDVIIFPSYLKHYVEPNLSAEDRISIAFNMV